MKAVTIITLLAALVVAGGCDGEAQKPADSKPPTAEAMKQKVEKEMADSKDGPDCATFVKETQQACRDRYGKGLLVDCHEFVTKANTTLTQKSEKVRQSMCGMFGKKLREAVATAATATPPPKCVALGKVIDERCISQIGKPDYHGQCTGVLITTGRQAQLQDGMCGAQATFFK